METKKRLARIYSKIVIDKDSQCWNWQGPLRDGYGRIYWKGKTIQAHRWFYNQKFGNLPDWKQKGDPEIDHICRNRACVNPDHLRVVSVKENILAGLGPTAINARKTVCKHGHSLVPDNRGHRKCKTCNTIYMSSEKRRAYKRKYYKEHYKKKKDQT